MREGVFRVSVDRLFEVLDGAPEPLSRPPVPVVATLQVRIVGLDVVRVAFDQVSFLSFSELDRLLPVLTLITGLELFYSALERSLSVAGFLGIANFLIALAVAYLTAASRAELTAGEGE